MKNIAIVIMLLCSTGIYTKAQSIDAGKIPAGVTGSFNSKFAKATSVKWEMENKTDYEANFSLDGHTMSAVFDKTGKWLETETAIKASSLPQPVSKAIAGKYAAYTVREAAMVETLSKGTIYEVDLVKGNEVMELQLSADGRILASKREGAK
jgi:uncharacterized membrane protein YkoI